MLNKQHRYNAFSVFLHWLMALLIISMVPLGVYMHDLPAADPLRFELYQLHKSTGIVILLLAAARLIWRLAHWKYFRLVNQSIDMSGLERIGSRIAHTAFYVLMFAVPMSGWMVVSSSELSVPTRLYGIIPWPDLPLPTGEQRAEIHADFKDRHEVLAFLMAGLLVLHIAAALKHHYLNRDGIMLRMLPSVARHWPGTFVMVFLLLIGGLLTTGLGLMSYDRQLLLNNDPSIAGSTHTDPAPVELPLRGAQHPETIRLDNSHGHLWFFWHQPIDPQQGSFEQFTAHLNLSDSEPQQRLLDVDIAMDDLSVAEEQAAEILPGVEWFNSAKFPAAHFRSTSVEPQASGWLVSGELTLRGVAQQLSFPLFVEQLTDDTTQVRGEFELIRQDFGIGQGEWMSDEYIGNKVVVRFDLQTVSSNATEDEH